MFTTFNTCLFIVVVERSAHPNYKHFPRGERRWNDFQSQLHELPLIKDKHGYSKITMIFYLKQKLTSQKLGCKFGAELVKPNCKNFSHLLSWIMKLKRQRENI